MSGLFSKIATVVRLYRQRRTTPLRLEINLTQACNLNCCGCTHYSPLAPADDAVEPGVVERTLRHLSQVKGINKVEHLYLIGGETLLYPHLEDVIAQVRRYFPVTPISLFTNGIMLPRMKDSFWQACQQYLSLKNN
ncbi:MAG: radical SAM protein, partial [Muribaculaceae bacterium]|nr:radical SAM protein [Muribaculaceae bacterium]